MNKIIEYATIIHNSYGDESLEKMVNQKIQEGFQPYGFPCVAGATHEDADKHKQSDFIIVQAMVKYEEVSMGSSVMRSLRGERAD